MARKAKPNGLKMGDIRSGTRFGFWEVVDPTPRRQSHFDHDNKSQEQKYTFIRCRCTACNKTEKNVRATYLINGHSQSCCLRGYDTTNV